MAEIFEKILDVDKCLILNPRQAVQRRMADAIVDEWTELRVGLFWSMTNASQDNALPVGESLLLNSLLDMPFFGFKNWYDLGQTSGDPNELAPGFAGTVFLGFGATQESVGPELFQNGTTSWILRSSQPNTWDLAGYNEASHIGSAAVGGRPECPYDTTASTLYAGFMGFKMTLANRGLSNQSVTLSLPSSSAVFQVQYTDVSAANLRTVLAQTVFSVNDVVAWNNGVSALQIPDSFYLRMPFYVNRIRLHAVGILRIS